MIWLEAPDVANLLGITERGVRWNADTGKYGHVRYIDGPGRGGRKLQIPLSGLPMEAQLRYLAQRTEPQEVQATAVATATAARRERGGRRAEILQALWQYLQIHAGQKPFTALTRDFCTIWNATKDGPTISPASVFRWQREYRSEGPDGLIDNRGGWNAGRRAIPKWAEERFLELYLDQARRSIRLCYSVVQIEAQARGEEIPAYNAFKRLAATIPYPTLVMYREGPDAFADKCEPYAEFDYLSLLPNDQWVTDHHRYDVLVEFEDGKIGRPWVSALEDRRSRRLMGWVVHREDPNTDHNLAVLAHAIGRFGLPEEVLMDNGLDYTADDLAGPGHKRRMKLKKQAEEDVRRARPLLAQLGIRARFALPYNAKGKHIERLFNTLAHQFSTWFLTYTGSNTEEKPERLAAMVKAGKAIPVAEFTCLFSRWAEHVYNEQPHTGQGMDGRSPREVFESIPFTKRVAPAEILHLLLMRTSRPLVVQRNGVRLFGRIWYRSDELVMHQGEKVYVRYDPHDLSRVYVYDLDDRFLSSAAAMDRLGWKATADDVRKAQREKARARKLAREYHRVQTERAVVPDALERVIAQREAQQARAAAGSGPPEPPGGGGGGRVVKMHRAPEAEAAARQVRRQREAAPISASAEQEVAAAGDLVAELTARHRSDLARRRAEMEAQRAREEEAQRELRRLLYGSR